MTKGTYPRNPGCNTSLTKRKCSHGYYDTRFDAINRKKFPHTCQLNSTDDTSPPARFRLPETWTPSLLPTTLLIIPEPLPGVSLHGWGLPSLSFSIQRLPNAHSDRWNQLESPRLLCCPRHGKPRDAQVLCLAGAIRLGVEASKRSRQYRSKLLRVNS